MFTGWKLVGFLNPDDLPQEEPEEDDDVDAVEWPGWSIRPEFENDSPNEMGIGRLELKIHATFPGSEYALYVD